ncbi:hypothetical protein D3C81_1468900 [compost metagenome]
MNESIIMTVDTYEALKGVAAAELSFAEQEEQMIDEYEKFFNFVCTFVSTINAESAFIEAAHKHLDPDTIFYLGERLKELEEAA